MSVVLTVRSARQRLDGYAGVLRERKPISCSMRSYVSECASPKSEMKSLWRYDERCINGFLEMDGEIRGNLSAQIIYD